VGRRCLLAPLSFCPSVSAHPCPSIHVRPSVSHPCPSIRVNLSSKDMSVRAASHAVNEVCGVVYAVYIYGNQNDPTCPENFAPIVSDWECEAAALFMGFSDDPLANSLGPIADYTSSSPISNGLCYWERWAEADRANITFRANQIQPAVDSGPLCAYGAPLSYTPSLYAASTRHCRPDVPNSLRSVPPTLYHLSSVATAPAPMPAYGLTFAQFQSQLCFVCSEARFPVDADEPDGIGDSGANKRTLQDGKLV
jgi:hypothetical protein